MGKVFAVASTVFFSIAFILFAFVKGNEKLVEYCTLLGLTSLALAHAF